MNNNEARMAGKRQPLPQIRSRTSTANSGTSITTDSAAQVKQLAMLGRGFIEGDAQWSSDGKLIAVVSSIGVWLYDANQPSAEPSLMATTTGVISEAFSSNGTLLATGNADNTIRLWDIKSRQ